MNRHTPRLLAIGLLANLLAGCASLTGDSFTFEGQLPANFAIKAQAHYGVANSCDGRSQTRSFEHDFEDAPQEYRFRIPISYHDGLCEMQLARVGLYIDGRYGDKDWERTYDNGSLVLVDTLPKGAPGFDASGTLSKTAECTWLFKMSTAISRKGEIDKLLLCVGAGAFIESTRLKNRTVRLDFRVHNRDQPYMKGHWIETPQGWKPCTGRWGTEQEELCTEPPQFRTFRMSGQECSVYPNCTE
ncbi:hypothetical protein [Stutzerimonas balearica]|uniref:hypothetical protein n=1 Tax=Stutzerimonas balearica TaxID=74829 RepID=UPI00289FE031|nr:hypothetical protein [Stutzerimonas balearica]